jgi:hypothetical protein
MKTKRTYNLSAATVDMVRRLVEEQHLAPSQDALVEMALADFFMAVRHEEEARQFAEAADDPEMRAELDLLEAEFASADRETWPE